MGIRINKLYPIIITSKNFVWYSIRKHYLKYRFNLKIKTCNQK